MTDSTITLVPVGWVTSLATTAIESPTCPSFSDIASFTLVPFEVTIFGDTLEVVAGGPLGGLELRENGPLSLGLLFTLLVGLGQLLLWDLRDCFSGNTLHTRGLVVRGLPSPDKAFGLDETFGLFDGESVNCRVIRPVSPARKRRMEKQ